MSYRDLSHEPEVLEDLFSDGFINPGSKLVHDDTQGR